MKQRADKKKILKIVLCVLIPLLLFYRYLPPINPLSGSFWAFCVFVSIIDVVICFLLGEHDTKIRFERGNIRLEPGEKWVRNGKRKWFSPWRIPLYLIGLVVLFHILSGNIFHARSYSQRMVPVIGEYEDLPTSEDLNHISLMDTSSARILGNRVIGSLSDVVSQFEVSDNYTTLVHKNTILKIAPLEYGGFFKYMNNKGNGIPGYVMVDTQSFDAKFIRRNEAPIRYSPSAYFQKNLKRHLRFRHPFSMFSDTKFEVDEEGDPQWVTGVIGHRFLLQGSYLKGAVVTDPTTGNTTYYPQGQIPEWVDNVFSGEFACELYNSYGMLRNGWLNSKIGQKGCLITTDDFGYLAKGNDLYIYTGITSAAADLSNLGFIMVDARTGDCTYVECAGAEEYSAMAAAAGVVQDYGYVASFPSLVTVDNVPTYAMVLKDNGGLVKSYAAVNVNNYTIVSVSSTLPGALKDYRRKVRAGIPATEGEIGSSTVTEATITVADVIYADMDGNTFAYLVTEDDKVYKMAVVNDERIVTVRAGDTVVIEYDALEENAQAITILSFEKKM